MYDRLLVDWKAGWNADIPSCRERVDASFVTLFITVRLHGANKSSMSSYGKFCGVPMHIPELCV